MVYGYAGITNETLNILTLRCREVERFRIRIFQLRMLSFWPTAECRAEQSFA